MAKLYNLIPNLSLKFYKAEGSYKPSFGTYFRNYFISRFPTHTNLRLI
jgi:hypothetical protein